MMGLGVATSGALSNLVVYLIKKYNVPSVDAAQISNIIAGCISLAPVAGAIVADAFFGCYPVVAVSMAFSVLVSARTPHIYVFVHKLVSIDRVCRAGLMNLLTNA
jgi:hypothetical protein